MTMNPHARFAAPWGAALGSTLHATALVTCLALAACGGGSDASGSASGSPSAESPTDAGAGPSADTPPAGSPAASAVTPLPWSTSLPRTYQAKTAADFGGMTPEILNLRGDIAGTWTEGRKTFARIWSDGKLLSSQLIQDCSSCISGYGHAYPSLNVLDENRNLFAAWVGKQGLEGKTTYLPNGSDTGASLDGCYKVYGASDAGEVLCHQANAQNGAGLWDLRTLSFTLLNGGETAINSAGTQAGVAAFTDAHEGTPIHRVFTNQAGKLTSAEFPGYSSAQVTRINAQNVVIGQRTLPGDVGLLGSFDPTLTRPFVWVPGSEPATLPCPSGYGRANAINRDGAMVGACGSGQDSHEQVLVAFWKDGQLVDLGAHMRTAAGWALSAAWAINDLGWILGHGRPVGSDGPEQNVVLIPQP